MIRSSILLFLFVIILFSCYEILTTPNLAPGLYTTSPWEKDLRKLYWEGDGGTLEYYQVGDSVTKYIFPIKSINYEEGEFINPLGFKERSIHIWSKNQPKVDSYWYSKQ